MFKIPKPILFVLIALLRLNTLHSQEIRVHDPVAIQQVNMYYLFCTGIIVVASKDLKNWEQRPPFFEMPPIRANAETLILEGNQKWNGKEQIRGYSLSKTQYQFFNANNTYDKESPKLQIAELRYGIRNFCQYLDITYK